MSFPFETEVEMIEESESCYEYGIDFATGQMTGEIVAGTEAIKVWVYTALKTERYRYVIYSWDHGIEMEQYIGKSYSREYFDTELPRMIEECLTMHPHIKGISDVDISIDGDKLTGEFTIETIYGAVVMDV